MDGGVSGDSGSCPDNRTGWKSPSLSDEWRKDEESNLTVAEDRNRSQTPAVVWGQSKCDLILVARSEEIWSFVPKEDQKLVNELERMEIIRKHGRVETDQYKQFDYDK